MISFVHGKLTEKHPTHVVVENNGVGFELLIPLSTFTELPEIGRQVKLYSHLHVREDAMTLIGFYSEEERSLFKLLLSVSGIGLRSALGILSGSKVNEVYAYIAEGNENALTRIPGLGKKTAQRLILDLRDKAASKLPALTGVEKKTAIPEPELFEEAVQAMLSLGYSRPEAVRAIEKAAESLSAAPTIEELLKSALQQR
ncbi:Holliday junction branch migration protein RuvA [candidate division KSB1 bacterium]|nr:Holliday junction branch migration protein RuvA [candidate division KSB1 bacterium]